MHFKAFFDPVGMIELFESTIFVKPKAPKCIRPEVHKGETGPKSNKSEMTNLGGSIEIGKRMSAGFGICSPIHSISFLT